MATFWDILKPEQKVKLAKLYRELAGIEFIPPDSSGQVVQCEPKIESLEEIDRLIRQRPHYSRRGDSRD